MTIIKLYSGSLEHYFYLHFTTINPTVFIIKLNVNRDKQKHETIRMYRILLLRFLTTEIEDDPRQSSLRKWIIFGGLLETLDCSIGNRFITIIIIIIIQSITRLSTKIPDKINLLVFRVRLQCIFNCIAKKKEKKKRKISKIKKKTSALNITDVIYNAVSISFWCLSASSWLISVVPVLSFVILSSVVFRAGCLPKQHKWRACRNSGILNA